MLKLTWRIVCAHWAVAENQILCLATCQRIVEVNHWIADQALAGATGTFRDSNLLAAVLAVVQASEAVRTLVRNWTRGYKTLRPTYAFWSKSDSSAGVCDFL